MTPTKQEVISTYYDNGTGGKIESEIKSLFKKGVITKCADNSDLTQSYVLISLTSITVRPNADKIGKVTDTCKRLLAKNYCTIRELASAIGLCLASQGCLNIGADIESRERPKDSEWKLDRGVFEKAVKHFDFYPEIDLFASHHNFQVDNDVSFTQDPEAHAIDAFSMSWINRHRVSVFAQIGRHRAESKEMILSSWRKGTVKQNEVYHRKWAQFCLENGISTHSSNIDHGIEFLTSLYKGGLKYSSLNAARSALSTIIRDPHGTPFGQHYLVKRFMKGTVKPFRPVSRSTVSRWCKEVLSNAGVDINVIGAHSIRSAATSYAKCNGMPINVIMKAAGWTHETSFEKYYNKTVDKYDDINFEQFILNA
eukprot:gene17064-8580_t